MKFESSEEGKKVRELEKFINDGLVEINEKLKELKESKEKFESKDEIVEFIWNFMNEYYDGEYEESLISWLDEKWGKKKNYDKFLRNGMEVKDDCVIYEVYEEEYVMLIEKDREEIV